MANDHDLFAELKRHNLLLPLLQQRTIAEAVANETPDSDKLNQARTAHLQRNGLKGDEELKLSWLPKDGMEDLYGKSRYRCGSRRTARSIFGPGRSSFFNP